MTLLSATFSGAADHALEGALQASTRRLATTIRLRVRDVRVFYDVVATEVHILAIVSKEQAENWLRKEGK